MLSLAHRGNELDRNYIESLRELISELGDVETSLIKKIDDNEKYYAVYEYAFVILSKELSALGVGLPIDPSKALASEWVYAKERARFRALLRHIEGAMLEMRPAGSNFTIQEMQVTDEAPTVGGLCDIVARTYLEQLEAGA